MLLGIPHFKKPSLGEEVIILPQAEYAMLRHGLWIDVSNHAHLVPVITKLDTWEHIQNWDTSPQSWSLYWSLSKPSNYNFGGVQPHPSWASLLTLGARMRQGFGMGLVESLENDHD